MIIWEGNNSEIILMVNDILVEIKNNIGENKKIFRYGIKYYYYARRRYKKK